MSGGTRDKRWDVRVAGSEDEIVRAASAASETNFTSFVRLAAVSEARRVLADRTKFELDEPDWRRFMELRSLFSKPSVFE
jgi:uncharacterized protein (DUF1778 family)